MTNKLFVGGLAYGVTDAQLNEHFAQAGKVLSAKVIIDKYTGQGKGFGFVEMTTEEEAKTAMDKLNGTQLLDRTIVVKEAKPQEDRNRGFQPRNDNNRNRW
ncbi:MAG TPA: RNA-binding protein [Patescibacteria group bacterium]|nr:RNA-binding protein [Patescibacteria group bacterium]